MLVPQKAVFHGMSQYTYNIRVERWAVHSKSYLRMRGEAPESTESGLGRTPKMLPWLSSTFPSVPLPAGPPFLILSVFIPPVHDQEPPQAPGLRGGAER